MNNLESIPLDVDLVNLEAIGALEFLGIEMPSADQVQRMERIIIGLLCPSLMRARIQTQPRLHRIPTVLSSQITEIRDE